MATVNAFDILRSAQTRSCLPKKLVGPFNQKLGMFNIVIDKFSKLEAGFSISECAPRIRNKKTGAATGLVFDIADILWKIKMAEIPLKTRSLWKKIPEEIKSLLLNVENKSHEQVTLTQESVKNFSVHIREIADKVLFSQPNLFTLKLSLLNSAEIFADILNVLKAENLRVKTLHQNDKASSVAEAIVRQISDREKVSLLEKGPAALTHPIVKKIVKELLDKGVYKPVNISMMLPTNKFSRSTLLHRTLP